MISNILHQGWLFRAAPLICLSTLLLSGCVSFTYQHDDMEQLMVARETQVAIESLDKSNLRKRDEILYLLNKGMLLRIEGDLQQSNQLLEQAKGGTQKLEALSLREQAVASTINDATRSYLPPFFEQVMLRCIKIINYLELGEVDSARIEALQLDELYQQHDEKLHLPFGRYLSGIVFEENREWDNALIAYRKAHELYSAHTLATPITLKQDMLRLTDHLGLKDEHQTLSKQFNLTNWPTQADIKKSGRIIAFIFNGLIPRKHSQEIGVQSFSDGQLHRISTPFYESRSPSLSHMTLISDQEKSRSEVAEQLEIHAEAGLSEAMPGIITRTIARVGVKNKLVDETTKENPLIGVALNLATFISEVADTRAWYSLPQQMLIARTYVEPGQHQVALSPDTSIDKSVTIEKGKTLFLSSHWPDSVVTHRRPNNETHIRPVYTIGIDQRVRKH